MPFSVPAFPLTVDVYSGPWLTKTLRFAVAGNLQAGRRIFTAPNLEATINDIFNGPAFLLVPALTDIRDLNQNVPFNDIVEVPSGSGRWYGVAEVEDVGKGFPNEFRRAAICKISANVNNIVYAGLFWPTPMT
jgi:hypothetical protein